jgi:enoyl-CoA hydratase/carnithine racemase
LGGQHFVEKLKITFLLEFKSQIFSGFAADVGVLQHFPKLLNNQSLMRELCFTARKIPSDEAERFGLVSRIFEDKEA